MSFRAVSLEEVVSLLESHVQRSSVQAKAKRNAKFKMIPNRNSKVENEIKSIERGIWSCLNFHGHPSQMKRGSAMRIGRVSPGDRAHERSLSQMKGMSAASRLANMKSLRCRLFIFYRMAFVLFCSFMIFCKFCRSFRLFGYSTKSSSVNFRAFGQFCSV